MDEISLVPYDAAWTARFEAECAALARALPQDHVVAIEHAGSTAIPGLEAKPIIDIFIAVRDVAAARASFVAPVTSLGYVYWAENPDPETMFFVKGMPPFGEGRTHHVHVLQPDTARWERVMLFRDHLRTDPAEAHRYVALKRELAARHRADREAYTRAKDGYVARVVEAARAKRNGKSQSRTC